MANDNNIKTYTAADIEKYHQGLLPAATMHEMEKASLDDPFLADALEGYAFAGTNATGDIAELKRNLATRVEGAKIIPLQRSSRFLRAAVAIAFIAGAGLLVYQLGFNKKSTDIAQVEPQKNETVRATDSSAANVPATSHGPVLENNPPVPEPGRSETTVVSDVKVKGNASQAPKEVTGEKTINGKETAGAGVTQPLAFEPLVTTPANTGGKDAEKKAAGREETSNKIVRQETAKEGAKDQTEDLKNNKAAAASRKADEQYYRDQASNTFRGRVTDAANVGVPFANVTNVQDNAGTYTDANGNFILTSPDSVLTVNIRSIGFENNNAQLRNDVTSNRVVLQDDRRSLSEVVVSNQQPNTAARAKNAHVTLEEPEPADGWANYDTYIANNLNVPEEYKTKQTNTASVELSFEVDKNGEPINIKIEKSLCGTCDKEAIRLVKDGPKWKRKAKKGRTTVTIPFNSSF